MKKIIIGTGLFMCGTLAVLTAFLRQAIYFASSNRIISDEKLLLIAGGTLFLIGIAICVSFQSY